MAVRSVQASEQSVIPRVVRHFGPDPAWVGGMGSVISVLTQNRMGGELVEITPTWRPVSISARIRLSAASVLRLLRMRRGQVAHIHLSQRGSFVREGALVALARRRGLVSVVTIHGSSFLAFAHKNPRLVSTVLRRAHLVTCLDPEVLALVCRLAPDTRTEILPNPVSIDLDSPPADQTAELVLFAGAIGYRKGADVLHEAWRLVAARRPQARCIMVGPLADFVVPDAERLDVRAPVDAHGVRMLLRSARVVVLPSRAEGMPMILTEAMGGGRPFVSTPVGGIPDLAHEGGVLVPVEDELALADRLTELLADPALARSIGERGRQYCTDTRSVPVIDARLRVLYAAAAGARERTAVTHRR